MAFTENVAYGLSAFSCATRAAWSADTEDSADKIRKMQKRRVILESIIALFAIGLSLMIELESLQGMAMPCSCCNKMTANNYNL